MSVAEPYYQPTDKGFFIDPTWIDFIPLVRHQPAWSFDVASGSLIITLGSLDSFDLRIMNINSHNFPLPAELMSFSEKALFVLECIIKVNVHEARESFEVGEAGRMFKPKHNDNIDNYAMPSL